MTRLVMILLFSTACAVRTAPPRLLSLEPQPPPPVQATEAGPAGPGAEQAGGASTDELASAEEALQDANASDAAAALEEEDDAEPSADEGEAAEAANVVEVRSGPVYTAELSDEALESLWRESPAALGSMSVGFVEAGRLVNGVRFPKSEDWLVVSPELAWATQETVEALALAIRKVRELHPNAPPLRVNQMSSKDGGYLRPHKSHQNGRDVDLGFYYPTVEPVRARERERYIDVALNWALVKSLVLHADLQFILVDHRVQKVLYEYALSIGEDKAWLDSLFKAGTSSILRHAKRHRDHFHVRFLNPRAQELGRRVAPLLALQPEHNVAMHRVRSGDTLGAIAVKYGSSVDRLRKANRIKGSFLRIGQVLSVPLRGPCTRCPIPPQMILPPRRLPPELGDGAPNVVSATPASDGPAEVDPEIANAESGASDASSIDAEGSSDPVVPTLANGLRTPGAPGTTTSVPVSSDTASPPATPTPEGVSAPAPR